MNKKINMSAIALTIGAIASGVGALTSAGVGIGGKISANKINRPIESPHRWASCWYW